MAIDPVPIGPPVAGHVKGPKNHIDYRKMDSEIHINRFLLYCMPFVSRSLFQYNRNLTELGPTANKTSSSRKN